MERQELPLSSPPDYNYECTGPFFVCHVDDEGRAQAWIMWVFDTAIVRFWLSEKTPKRRVMVDAYGVTVIATQSESDDRATMSGTRQTMDATLKMVAVDGAPIETQAVILTMVDGVRRLGGQAL